MPRLSTELSNCAIRERTGDGVSTGRCWHHLQDGKTCPMHGDVSAQMAEYRRTAQLQEDPNPTRKP